MPFVIIGLFVVVGFLRLCGVGWLKAFVGTSLTVFFAVVLTAIYEGTPVGLIVGPILGIGLTVAPGLIRAQRLQRD